MTQNPLPRRILTDAQVARFWRRVFLGQAVLLVVTAGAAWLIYTRFKEQFDSWVDPMVAVPIVLLCHWLTLIGQVPLPALDWRARRAVVTSMKKQAAGDSSTACLVVRLRTEGGDESEDGGGLDVKLADMVSIFEDHRFHVGSKWMVHVFEKNPAVAVLAEDHEDVKRGGYDLTPIGRARTMYPEATGSKLLKRRFRDR